MSNERRSDMSDKREGTTATQEERQAADTRDICQECKCTDGQHSRKCSYNIANLI